MSYQVFARKYRPRTFEEVVGQEHITQTLANAIKLGRLAQAYIFVGPRGTGKTSTARILAKALNATDGPRVDFDPDEEISLEIAEGNCLDVLEIDGASNNGVEQVRDLRDNVRYSPAKGRFKIYYIDEVHMLSTAAFNALLKTLEEPPAHVKFIFATTEAHKVPATILSRCQRFDLRRIPDAKIASHLEWICAKEGVTAEPAAIDAIARYAEGGLRDAESALDQVISFYGDRVAEREVLDMFGLTGLGPVAALAGAIARGDTVEALAQSRALIEGGKDLGRLSQELLRFFRNLVIHQLSPKVLANELSGAEVAALDGIAGQITRQGALAILEELSTLEGRLRYALAKDVLFEVALIQLSQLREKVSLEKILGELTDAGADESRAVARAHAMGQTPPAPTSTEPAPAPEPGARVAAPTPEPEAKPPAPTPAAPEATPAEPPAPKEVSTKTEASDKATSLAREAGSAAKETREHLKPSAEPVAQPREKWNAAAEEIAEEIPDLAAFVKACQFKAYRLDEKEFEIAFPAAMNRDFRFASGPKHGDAVNAIVARVCGHAIRPVFMPDEKLEPPRAAAEPAEEEPPGPSLSQEDFVNDPLIKEALHLFEAKVVKKEMKA